MNLELFLLVVSLIAFMFFLLSANLAAPKDLLLRKMTYWYLILTMCTTLGILMWKVIEIVKNPF